MTGMEKEIYVGVVVDVWEDEERARLLAALNGVVMLRCEACEEISSMSPASLLRWEERIDIELLAVVESSLCAFVVTRPGRAIAGKPAQNCNNNPFFS